MESPIIYSSTPTFCIINDCLNLNFVTFMMSITIYSALNFILPHKAMTQLLDSLSS